MSDVVATTAEGPRPARGGGTLARRLVLRMVALVAVVALLLSAFTALAVRQLLVNQLDAQVDTISGRLLRDGGPPGSTSSAPPYGIKLPGQPIDTLVIIFPTSGTPQAGILRERGRIDPVPKAAGSQVAGVPAGERATTLDLAGVGRYRVSVTETDGGKIAVGLPLDAVDKTLTQVVVLELLLSLLGMGGAALVATSLVERSLRPLNRVAATAQHVSQLELDRGEVALAVRVPPEDSDPTSEVGRVGQAINHMLNNVAGALTARQASEMKVRQFVADASHELRNPLAAIRGYAELTRRDRDQMPPNAAYAMSRVESEAERMSQLVEDLLLLARLDSGPALDIRPTDLTELVINAVSDARAAGPEHVWSLHLPDVPVTALGDAHRLLQVVANLLANARTHTPAGTRVETGLSVAGGAAVLTVTDDGPGVPPEIQDNMFERFTRADTSRVRAAGAGSGASTGLGLAIVSAVVEAHQGSVTVSSVPGRTEFSIWLPLADQPELTPVR